MTSLPSVDFKPVEKVLVGLGFRRVRQRGSHVLYRHRDGRTTTIPHQPDRKLSRPLLREILREIETAPEAFLGELEKH